jgi:DNA-binding transcriptional regulator YdaS (Cro superfamily)
MESASQSQFSKGVAAFGSIKAFAEKIGCKYVSVYAWGMRGGKVPKKHHSAIIAASEGKLTQTDFE